LCKFYDNAGGQRPIQRQLLFSWQYNHQANQLLLMNDFTPLLISRNDKNKQLTLLSQRKLAQQLTFCIKIIGAPKKLKNQPCPLVGPHSVNFFQNFFEISREIVPF
jgi:hypothetical protein